MCISTVGDLLIFKVSILVYKLFQAIDRAVNLGKL